MRKALVIGIDEYASAPLKGCVNDASAFANSIKTNGDGSPNFDVKLATNIQTKAELRGGIASLFEGDAEVALLFFSGHGTVDEVGGYIVTPDYNKNDPGVSMYDVLVMANNSKAKNRIIILDCCNSGVFGSPQTAGENVCKISEGVTVLTASRGDESAIEANGYGIFTNLLIGAVQGEAADLLGHVTPGSVYAYIDQALGSWDQRPVFKTNITRFVLLRKIPPKFPLETLRKICEYFPTPEHEFNLDPTYEPDDTVKKRTEDMAKPENVVILKDLQKFVSINLVVPIGEDHMFYAAMNSKTCKLTALGSYYWRLVKNGRI